MQNIVGSKQPLTCSGTSVNKFKYQTTRYSIRNLIKPNKFQTIEYRFTSLAVSKPTL